MLVRISLFFYEKRQHGLLFIALEIEYKTYKSKNRRRLKKGSKSRWITNRLRVSQVL
jgi:hypothetical protein